MITTDWLTMTTLAYVDAFQDVKTQRASTAITAVEMTLFSEMADGAIAPVDLSNLTCLPVKSKFNFKCKLELKLNLKLNLNST